MCPAAGARRITSGSCLRRGTVTGVISSARLPFSIASPAFAWLQPAKTSWSSREIPYSSATFSAVSGIVSIPYCSFMILLTNRQPMVVSKISALRLNAAVALPITKGARDMDSTPPAITSSCSPVLTARAAMPIASIPEAHSLFTVTPGTSGGSPASSSAIRATSRLSSPAWLAHP